MVETINNWHQGLDKYVPGGRGHIPVPNYSRLVGGIPSFEAENQFFLKM